MNQINLLFTGREYHSLENCLVNVTDAGVEINSTIIGKYGEKIYHVEYHIKTNAQWQTLSVEIKSRHSNKTEHLYYNSDGKGNWKVNGQAAEQFNGCIDVDIPLTPFTNTLPINCLQLKQGNEKEIRVLYFDLLENEIKAVSQKYSRLSKTVYHYENIPNDFEADITVDENGFVVDYPALFVRTAAITSNYH